MQKDPTLSGPYVALRNALVSIQDDASAVLSVLSSLSDGGQGWLTTAFCELRRSLVQGRLREAEALGRLMATVLEVREQTVEAEAGASQQHREAMRCLIDGIGAMLSQDDEAGIEQLEQLTGHEHANPSLRWVAWEWTARGAIDKGDLLRAKPAAQAALALSEKLDSQAIGTSLCTLGEIDFVTGDQEPALEHLIRASSVFEEIGDERGMATARLSRARMLSRLQRDDEAVEAAREAQAADPRWEQPAVFLSEWLLSREMSAEADAVLRPFAEADPVSPQVGRQARLVEDLRQQRVSAEVIRRYFELRDRVPTEPELTALQSLRQEAPGLHAVRELLAWNLVKLGKEEEARQHFEELAGQELDPEIRASVLLGLGCLASRRLGHRESAARVRAAASAVKPQPPAAAPPRFVTLDGNAIELINELSSDVLVEEPAPPSRPPPLPGQPLQARVTAARLILPPPPAEGASEEPKKERSKRPTYPPAPVPKAVFSGDLQLLAVPDLLEFLRSGRRTGTLVITSGMGIGAVHMRRGMITGAASPSTKSMGVILKESGQVTEAQLQEAAEHQRANSPDRLLGAILVDRGQVSREALQQALIRQIKNSVMEMVGWSAGRFAFEPDKRGQADASDVEVELDTQEVLLDVFRELDELNRDSFEAASDRGSEETTADGI